MLGQRQEEKVKDSPGMSRNGKTQGDDSCCIAVDNVTRRPGKKGHLLHCQGQKIRCRMTKGEGVKP